jgi:hypothetical protein
MNAGTSKKVCCKSIAQQLLESNETPRRVEIGTGKNSSAEHNL